jgi:hypothetical protein
VNQAEALLVTYRQGPAFMAASAGRLCIFDGTVSFGPVYAIFPAAETRWDGQHLTLRGRRYSVGDPITIGGGCTSVQMAVKSTAGFVPPSHWRPDDPVCIVA